MSSLDLLARIAEALGGSSFLKIVEALRELGRATDDQLSVKTKLQLNEARRILYALYNLSLVSVERERDEKTGWFIFYWKLQPDVVESFVSSRKLKILQKLRARLEYERSHDFYACQTLGCDLRVPFEEAIELVFRCPKCGKPLTYDDNDDIVSILEQRIRTIEKELSA